MWNLSKLLLSPSQVQSSSQFKQVLLTRALSPGNLLPGITPPQGPEEGYSYLSEEERYYEIETREELLTSGPELLVVPTVAEVEMLKREQEESKRAMVELQKRTDTYREEYEVLERWVWSLIVGMVTDNDVCVVVGVVWKETSVNIIRMCL